MQQRLRQRSIIENEQDALRLIFKARGLLQCWIVVIKFNQVRESPDTGWVFQQCREIFV